MILLLAALVCMVFCVIAWRAVEGLLNGLVGGVMLFCRLAGFLIYSNCWCAARAWRWFKRLQIATAQRLYAWWFGYYWRWQRRYIARALRARRAARHA